MNYTDTLISEYLNEELDEMSGEFDTLGNQLSEQQAEYFKDSKVEQNGKLEVCYHYSNSDFDIFDKSKINKGMSGGFNMWGAGFYFTNNGNSNAYNLPYKKTVYLNIENPYYLGIADSMEQIESFITNAGYDFSKYTGTRPSTKAAVYECCGITYQDDFRKFFVGQILKQGFDGLIIVAPKTTEYVVYESNQIKSIDNKYPTKDENINK